MPQHRKACLQDSCEKGGVGEFIWDFHCRLSDFFLSGRAALIRSSLPTGLLCGAPEYQIKKLQRVMNATARLDYRAPKYCHITPLQRKLQWLPVCLRVEFKILLVKFKILHGVAPSYLKDLVSVLPDSHYQLRRNNNGILLGRPRLRTKKTMGDRAFSIAPPFLWNSLPLPIRQET